MTAPPTASGPHLHKQSTSMGLKRRNSSLVSCPPSKKEKEIDYTMAGAEAALDAHPVSWKANSCSAAYSGLYNECVLCQLLCQVAPESRDPCRRSRPTGQEDSSGFRNDLSFTFIVFLLDSSEMAQLAIGCSEGRNCAGDRDCNSSSQREEAVLSTATSALGNESLALLQMMLCPIKLMFISAGEVPRK